ncbi:MAG: glycoside hydrolase family 2 TIM barrel-domain containing protein [Rikenellaceae bacterium]
MIVSRFITLTIAALVVTTSLSAQPLYRTQIAPYSKRSASASADHSTDPLYVEFDPTLIAKKDGKSLYSKEFTYPVNWSDGLIVLHLENLPEEAVLLINEVAVTQIKDTLTPLDIDISDYLHQGENSIEIVTMGETSPLESEVDRVERKPFSSSYITSQGALHIKDFVVSIVRDPEKGNAQLWFDVIVDNRYPQPREVEIGFDIYDPTGKLIDYDFRTKEIGVDGVDTISFSRPIWGAAPYRWGVVGDGVTRKGVGSAQSSLYSLTLYTRLGGVLREYIPFKVGYTDFDVVDGKLTLFGKNVDIKSHYLLKSAATRQECQKELLSLKNQGVNMIITKYPQPQFFYELTDQLGLLVIDGVSINAPQESGNRAVGGTPANDPTLLDEYLSRGKAAYYRSRNHTSVVGYSLSGVESGNGYNMYRLYETLRDSEPWRPIIYQGAQGEWNSDVAF